MCRDQTRCGFVVEDVPEADRAAREHLQAWLALLCWPEPAAADVVLAVHEAIAAARGASTADEPRTSRRAPAMSTSEARAPLQVSTTVTRTGEGRLLTVLVHGTTLPGQASPLDDAETQWRPAQSLTPESVASELGLQLMRQLMDDVAVAAGPDHRTTVRLRSGAVPA